MFEKFGEFDGVEELNLTAAGLLKEGDSESILILAKENGIDIEDAQDYIDGLVDEFASLGAAAYGRVFIEEKDGDKLTEMEKIIKKVLCRSVRHLCEDREFCTFVMKKGKRIMDVHEGLKKGANKHKTGSIGVSCGTDRELETIIRAYYMDGDKAMMKEIEKLYEV